MLINGLTGWLADGPSSPFDAGIDFGAMVSVAGSIEVANEVVASGAVVEVVEGASATVEVVEAGWSCSRLAAGASESIVGAGAAEFELPPHAEVIANRARPATSLLMI